MPTDNVTVSNGLLDPYKVSADDANDGSGELQRVKLATSGDGESTHIPADATNGLDVDVTRVRPGTGTTDLGKAEDSPHTSGDTGVAVWGVRKDAGGAFAGDGDYHPLSLDSQGALRVAATGLTGGVQFNEDTAHASGDAGTQSLGVRKDTPGSLENTDGDYAPFQVDAQGYVRVVGEAPLYGPSEYTTDDALPANPTGPLVMTRKASTPAATTPVDGDAQGLRSSNTGALWTAADFVNHPFGAATVLRAVANVNTGSTDSIIVAGVAGKKIRVLQLFMVAGATAQPITLNTKPAGAGTPISPLISNAANGGEVLPFSPLGWFETNTGDGLSATTPAGGSATGIGLAYILV